MAAPAANVNNDQPQQQNDPVGGDNNEQPQQEDQDAHVDGDNNDQPQQQDAPDGGGDDQPQQDDPDSDDNDEQQEEEDIADGGADYSRYYIVEEKEIALRKMSQGAPHIVRNRATGRRRQIPWDRRVRTQMFNVGSIEFKLLAGEARHANCLLMANAYAEPNQVEAAGFSAIAEVVVWKWKKHAVQKILRKSIVSAESTSHCHLTNSDEYVFCIIRQLRERKMDASPCPPLDEADAFTITVGAQQFVASAHLLQWASPVFRTMLNVCDKADRKVTLNDDEPEEFRAFLHAITPGNDVLPNPQNVRGLLKLAEKYQADFVKKQCAQHLRFCEEITLLERLVIADQYGLDLLKNNILLCMSADQLRAFYKANSAELRARISRRLLDELVDRAMGNDEKTDDEDDDEDDDD